MSTLKCLSCDHDNDARAKFCQECGLPLNLKLCTQCEAINEKTAEKCHACGTEFAVRPAPQPPQLSPSEAAAPAPAARSAHRTRVVPAALVVATLALAGAAYYLLLPARKPEVAAAPQPLVSEALAAPAPKAEPATPKPEPAVTTVKRAPKSPSAGAIPDAKTATAPLVGQRPAVTHTKPATEAAPVKETARAAEAAPVKRAATDDAPAGATIPAASATATDRPAVTHLKRTGDASKGESR